MELESCNYKQNPLKNMRKIEDKRPLKRKKILKFEKCKRQLKFCLENSDTIIIVLIWNLHASSVRYKLYYTVYSRVRLNGQVGRIGLGQKVLLASV